jgi:hypothetical protein
MLPPDLPDGIAKGLANSVVDPVAVPGALGGNSDELAGNKMALLGAAMDELAQTSKAGTVLRGRQERIYIGKVESAPTCARSRVWRCFARESLSYSNFATGSSSRPSPWSATLASKAAGKTRNALRLGLTEATSLVSPKMPSTITCRFTNISWDSQAAEPLGTT